MKESCNAHQKVMSRQSTGKKNKYYMNVINEKDKEMMEVY